MFKAAKSFVNTFNSYFYLKFWRKPNQECNAPTINIKGSTFYLSNLKVVRFYKGIMAEWLLRVTVNYLFNGSIPFDA